MAPKRKAEDLKLKSIWDETLVREVMDNEKHRTRMWQWLVLNPDKDVCDVPLEAWRVKKSASTAIFRDFVKFTSKIVEKNESIRGDTTKLLIELQDGHRVETVVMKHVSYSTVCVSSQIGCQMGCRFCATGTMGIIGNLTSGEILEQLAYAINVTKIRNVVFMGMGEPLNNYDNVKLAIESMVDCNRFGLSPRHVTVSTVGVLKAMRRLSEEMPFVSLALSLHAPNQEVRLKIVPAASAHHINKLMDAVDYHIAKHIQAYSEHKARYHQGIPPSEDKLNNIIKRQSGSSRPNKISGVMMEYILIKDINDQEDHAIELAKLLYPRRDHVILNLIPYNPTEVAEDYEPPSEESVARFHEICMSPPYELHTRVRQEKGQDIAGACGQLALVNPGKNANIDIEDAGNSQSTGSSKNTNNHGKNMMKKDKKLKKECSGDTNTCQSIDCNGKISNNMKEKKEFNIGNSKVLCYASIIVPIMLLTTLGKMKLYS